MASAVGRYPPHPARDRANPPADDPGVLSSTHVRTSAKVAFRPTPSNNSHHTASRPCSMAKPSALYTVHCLRRRQNRIFHRVQPQSLHCPLLLTSCCRSNLTAAISNRTACSSITACATGCSPLSRPPAPQAIPTGAGTASSRHCSLVPIKLNGIRGQGDRILGLDVPFDDDDRHPVRSSLQTLASRNQPLRIVLLLRRAGAAFNDSHGERRHIAVQACQLGKKFPILSDHGRTPDSCAHAPWTAPGPGRVHRQTRFGSMPASASVPALGRESADRPAGTCGVRVTRTSRPCQTEKDVEPECGQACSTTLNGWLRLTFSRSAEHSRGERPVNLEPPECTVTEVVLAEAASAGGLGELASHTRDGSASP